MSNAKFPVRSAALLCVALLFASAAWAIDFTNNAAVSACDNYGVAWSISAAACNPAAPLTLCLGGNRDTGNVLGCGPLTINGDYVLLLGIFSAMTSAATTGTECIAAFWQGSGLTTITGNWHNEEGLGSFSFTLTAGVCPTGILAAGGPKPNVKR